MATRKETYLSVPGSRVIDSFMGRQIGDDLFNRLIHHEEKIIGNLLKRKDGLVFDDKSESKFQSFDDAACFAAAEIGALTLDYPQLMGVTPTFPYIYRLLRSNELFYNLPRGDKTLMVGSGSTIAEFLAQYVEPPKKDRIEQTLNYWKPRILKNLISNSIRKVEEKGYPEVPIQLVRGVTTAVEPIENKFRAAQMKNMFFAIPDGKIVFLQNPIRQVLEENAIPKNSMSSILWHRAEPLIVTRPESLDFDEGYLRKLLFSLCTLLIPDGHITISVGGGNNFAERDLRLSFLQKSSEMLSENGTSILNPESLFFHSRLAKSLFFNHAAGMLGYVIARKDKKPRSVFGFSLPQKR